MKRLRQIFRRYGWRTPVVAGWLVEDRWLRLRERVVLLSLKLKTKGTKGSGLRLGRRLWVSPGGNLSLGNKVHIGDDATLEISINPEGVVSVGEDTWISRNFHLHSTAEIAIGRDVLIGEFVSIRDTTHSFEDASVPVKKQPDVNAPVYIEDGVWIGRGCLIQSKVGGMVIGRGAIIGANSVITQSVPAMEIWAGAPARFIKQRNG